MAQAKTFSWYKQEMPLGIAGMKANTSVDVCDTYSAEGNIEAGDAVVRETNGGIKTAGDTGDGAKVIGIAIHNHKESSEPYYTEGESISVMSFGDIYVKAGSDVDAGDTVALTIAGGKATFVASATTNAEAVSGITFMDSAVEGDIVRVRIRK